MPKYHCPKVLNSSIFCIFWCFCSLTFIVLHPFYALKDAALHIVQIQRVNFWSNKKMTWKENMHSFSYSQDHYAKSDILTEFNKSFRRCNDCKCNWSSLFKTLFSIILVNNMRNSLENFLNPKKVNFLCHV